MIWHLLPLSRSASFPLSASPFLHACSDLETLLAVANALYTDADEPMVALELDPDQLPVRYEPADPAPPPGVSAETLFPHVFGPVDAAAVVSVRYARRDPAGVYVSFDSRPATAAALDLLPHPEGGWFRQTWVSDASFTPDGYPGPRAAATLIYFLLGPGDESRWHAVRSDEIWLWHSGGPLTLLTASTIPAAPVVLAPPPVTPVSFSPPVPAAAQVITLGPDLATGQRPHHVIPGGSWQAARPATDAEVLVSCVVSPGFDFADFTTS
ncbi:MAG: cupin domain-containing protein [Streptosporangiaceae bacterium]